VFPGVAFDRSLLDDYLKGRTAALRQGAMALTSNAIAQAGGPEEAAEQLAARFDLVAIELGESEGLPPEPVSKRTEDPTRATPWDRDPAVPHDRYRIRRRIVAGDPGLLTQWPDRDGGFSSVALTTYDDQFVYVTWDVPIGEDPSRMTAVAKEHIDRLDRMLAASRREIDAWRAGLSAAAAAAVTNRNAVLATADRAYSSVGVAPASPSEEDHLPAESGS
jgi:hypothetical protein